MIFSWNGSWKAIFDNRTTLFHRKEKKKKSKKEKSIPFSTSIPSRFLSEKERKRKQNRTKERKEKERKEKERKEKERKKERKKRKRKKNTFFHRRWNSNCIFLSISNSKESIRIISYYTINTKINCISHLTLWINGPSIYSLSISMCSINNC